MTKVTNEQWWELAKMIKSAFPHDQHFMASKEDAMVWYNVAESWEYDIAKIAIWDCIKASKFPPAISELETAYQMQKSKQDSVNNQIREIYKAMENYYPVCLRDEDRVKTFSAVLKEVDGREAVEKALKIKKRVVKAVEEAEKSGKDDLPTLSECIRRCTND
jgi:hypothetical protein